MENPQNATWSCGDVFESACSLFHDYQSTRNNRKHADADAELEDRLRGQLRTFVKEVQRNEAYLGFSSPTTLQKLLDMCLERDARTTFAISALKALNNCIIANPEAQTIALDELHMVETLLSLTPLGPNSVWQEASGDTKIATGSSDGALSVEGFREKAQFLKVLLSFLARLTGTNRRYAETLLGDLYCVEAIRSLVELYLEDLPGHNSAHEDVFVQEKECIVNGFTLLYNSLARLGGCCQTSSGSSESQTNMKEFEGVCRRSLELVSKSSEYARISSSAYKLLLHYDWLESSSSEHLLLDAADSMIKLWDVLDHQELEEEIGHMFLVMHSLVSKYPAIKQHLQEKLAIEEVIRTNKRYEAMTLALQLVFKRLQTIDSTAKRFAGELLYSLCGNSSKKYVALTGMERALPILQAKGEVSVPQLRE
eukprot:gb/GECG01000583.1/.p1 GENE.gb/GECG01000583.1/~~gb/GECG01000583.1/.p1  ORF type:complete len:425 (+),score=60.01 gb/GECG01000583.1/:1-1275(+)